MMTSRTPWSSAISQREKNSQVVSQLETLADMSSFEMSLKLKRHDASFLRKFDFSKSRIYYRYRIQKRHLAFFAPFIVAKNGKIEFSQKGRVMAFQF